MFVKIEIWNFQHIFDFLFRETSQNFSSFELYLNELKFCKVSRKPKSNSCWKFQLSILTNKKVLTLKNIWSVPSTMDSSFFSQQMPYCLLTLLVYMALEMATKNVTQDIQNKKNVVLCCWWLSVFNHLNFGPKFNS